MKSAQYRLISEKSQPGGEMKMQRLCSRWQRLRDQQGATLVEFALSSAVLFSLLFGILIACLALYSYNAIAEAAREGARFAIVRGSSSCGFNTPCKATTTDVSNYVKSQAFPGVDTTRMTVTANWPTTGINCTPSVVPCNNPSNLVTVTVGYSFPMVIPFVPSQTLNMSSTAQMVIAH